MTETPPAQVPVTQVDRDAAGALIRCGRLSLKEMVAADDSDVAQAFARQSSDAQVVALIEARDALHQHYVDWDGEPEDAVPLQLARAKCDAVLTSTPAAVAQSGE